MPQVGQLQPKNLPAYGGYKNDRPCSGYTWENLGAEKQPVMKRCWKATCTTNPLLKSRESFSLWMLHAMGKGGRAAVLGDSPRRRHQPWHHLSSAWGKKSLFLQFLFQSLWIWQGTGLHWLFDGTRALFSLSVCLGLVKKRGGKERHEITSSYITGWNGRTEQTSSWTEAACRAAQGSNGSAHSKKCYQSPAGIFVSELRQGKG